MGCPLAELRKEPCMSTTTTTIIPPDGDLELLSWSDNLQGKVSAAPPSSLGLAASDVTALVAAFGAYQTTLAIARDPATRTKVTIADKQAAKKSLLAVARRV